MATRKLFPWKTWAKQGLEALFFALLGLTAGLLAPSPVAAAEEVMVAVAANFILPFEELARAFELRSPFQLKATHASTGSLYAQIRNGAPYHIFLAADEARPRALRKDGLAEEPFVYAKGKVVLWTRNRELCLLRDWREVAGHSHVARLASANPETAPYGAATLEALRHSGLWAVARSKLVYAQSVAQSFHFAYTEAVDAAFCALSSALAELGRKGCYWEVREAPTVTQAACLLKKAVHHRGAQEFMAFIVSPEAQRIKERYGYE